MQNNKDYHPQDLRNLMIFIAMSVLLWFAYDHFIMKPKVEAMRAQQAQQAKEIASFTPEQLDAQKEKPRPSVIEATRRLSFDNGVVYGTINLTGARLDDLHLHDYYTTVEKTENVVVLSPAGGPFPRYLEYGWVAQGQNVRTPASDTVWQVQGNSKLTAETPVTLIWNNGQGLRFEKTISLDDSYGFAVEQRVVNNTGREVTLYPYALVTEHGLPAEYFHRWIIHEGPIGYIGGELIEHKYDDIADKRQDAYDASTGWIGITEKYWLAALVPPQDEAAKYRFTHTLPAVPGAKERYQVDITGAGRTVAAGETATYTTHSFIGAKKVSLLEGYEKEWGVAHFDLAVDFGLFYFLTRPFFFILNLFYGLVGNFGVAIIMFTVLLRICVFPLANTSFRSFAKMRQVSPQMYELREQYKDDKKKLQEELVKLYQREKVNPMAGCLPILVQIPIFFALFKVLSNTIEMRHAPFFGWIQDLSMPDPTTIFNLFGLIPWTPPQFLMIGVWPILMLLTMLVQRRLSPPPQDKTQAMVINMMPWLMTFILAGFASGLVIYWTFNNLLSVIQQYIIMRRMGVEVHLFKRSKEEERLEQAVMDGPSIHPEVELAEEQVEEALFGEGDGPVKPAPKRVKKKKK
jgi:YidC/Oxa1 family membrane protein insertase